MIDIATGLAATASALSVIKEIKDIDKALSQAELKAKLAEVYTNLADVKMALSDAREALHAKDSEIRELEAKLKARIPAKPCPICKIGELETISVRPHPTFGTLGSQEHTLKCSNCTHTETRKVKP